MRTFRAQVAYVSLAVLSTGLDTTARLALAPGSLALDSDGCSGHTVPGTGHNVVKFGTRRIFPLLFLRLTLLTRCDDVPLVFMMALCQVT